MHIVKNLSLIRLFKWRYLFALAFFLTAELVAPRTAVAVTLNQNDYEMYRDNDVLYYQKGCLKDRQIKSNDAAPTGDTQLRGANNEEKVWNYLKDQGYSDEQAAGIMGNLAWESGDKTFEKATNSEELSGGGGYGLAQWTGARRTEINEAAKKQGVSVTDLKFQLDYLNYEINTRTEKGSSTVTEAEGLKKLQSVDDATKYFMDNFERPGVPHLDKRMQLANEYLEKYGGGQSASKTAGASADCNEKDAPTSATCGSGGFGGTLLCYAWPDFKGLDTTPTEEYKAAIEKASSEGRYVGGTRFKGIDCGGFVSLLLQDSGFEPAYNYSGKGGNTTSQYKWTKENWETLGQGNTINVADLKQGDVANNESTHTFIFVGEVSGFNANIASASWDERAPMADPQENPTASQWTWFRKK